MKDISKLSERELRQELTAAIVLIRYIAAGMEGELFMPYQMLCQEWLRSREQKAPSEHP
jgi:hypothetical protein